PREDWCVDDVVARQREVEGENHRPGGEDQKADQPGRDEEERPQIFLLCQRQPGPMRLLHCCLPSCSEIGDWRLSALSHCIRNQLAQSPNLQSPNLQSLLSTASPSSRRKSAATPGSSGRAPPARPPAPDRRR